MYMDVCVCVCELAKCAQCRDYTERIMKGSDKRAICVIAMTSVCARAEMIDLTDVKRSKCFYINRN